MQNVKELRDSLIENYKMLKSGTMPISMGKELANTAGKVLNSVKIELEYKHLTGSDKKIEFLDVKY